jgi:OTU domain-containing protein 6
MEDLLARHRKEKKDLQGKITQKKKSASKKTRKGVNDECDSLEQALQERQAEEIAALKGDTNAQDPTQVEESSDEDQPLTKEIDDRSESQLTTSLDVLSVSSNGVTQPKKKPNRAKERLARRAAEQVRVVEEAKAEAQNMPDLQTQEKERMAAILQKRGLTEKVVRADGHCLYAATADQLHQRGQEVKVGSVITFNEEYRTVRYVAADFIENHPDDFVPFLEEDLGTYLEKVRDTGEWGGQVELMALSKAYGVKICVVHGDGNVIEIGEGDDDKRIWLAYYRHGFGLGEHYNSLRAANS